jgi:transcriptional regulator with XRE-family HTH domain
MTPLTPSHLTFPWPEEALQARREQAIASRQTLPWTEEFLRALGEDDYRHAYLADQVRTNIAFQIRALRDQRGWTQKDLAEKAGKPANSISRLEDPDYGKLTLTTLLEMARAFDVALLVQFVEHDDWLNRMADVSPSALRKRSFSLGRLLSLARTSEETSRQAPSQLSTEHVLPIALSGSSPTRVSQVENLTVLSLSANQARQHDVLSGKLYQERFFL